VLTNPRNTAIGDRAISDDAACVARVGRVVLETMHSEGLAACGKHFPGHGDTVADSHDELPLVDAPPDRLEAVELLPFREAIAAGAAFLMVGHLHVPSLDEAVPATFSRVIVEGWLRQRLGFDGVILTDDLDMKAVSATRSIEEIAVEAIGAGCDGLLICGESVDRQVAALEALIHAVEVGTLPLPAVERAYERHRRAKERFLAARPPSRPRTARELRDLIGIGAHQAIAEALAQFA
jgi:beta-N-acetylhexosaminidase